MHSQVDAMEFVTKPLHVRCQLSFRFAYHSVCLLNITYKTSEFLVNDLMLCQRIANLFSSRRVVTQVPNKLFSPETKAKFETALTVRTALLVNKPLRL